jgi:16S rRNA (guanine527-N7)-methyltransferase
LKPGRQALETILQRCGIALDESQLDLLWRYHRLLRGANEKLNLTRIHNFENMVLKHYVDSLLVLKFLELPSPLVDMGSGPGVPGIPLKIARPQTRMILAEPRGARAEFLRTVCTRLGLDGVEVYAGKVGPDFPGKANGVITRAVGEISEVLDRSAKCLPPGGRVMLMKGPNCEAEIAQAERDQTGSFRLAEDYAYVIPGTPHHRRLVVYERLEDKASVAGRTCEPNTRTGRIAREVSSESNATFRLFAELLSGRGIRKHGQAIVAGNRIVREILTRSPQEALAWITETSGTPPPSDALVWYRLSKPRFRDLDVAGTNSPLLLVRVPAFAHWSDDGPWPDGCSLFVPFQDPENVGAVIRSAAAFGASRVILLKEAAHPFHPKSSRAAGTALFQVQLLLGPSLRDVRSRHAPLIALDTNGPELGEAPFPKRFGLIVGLEGPGLPERFHQGERRRVGISGAVESLNAATAAAIALYSWSRGRTHERE